MRFLNNLTLLLSVLLSPLLGNSSLIFPENPLFDDHDDLDGKKEQIEEKEDYWYKQEPFDPLFSEEMEFFDFDPESTSLYEEIYSLPETRQYLKKEDDPPLMQSPETQEDKKNSPKT